MSAGLRSVSFMSMMITVASLPTNVSLPTKSPAPVFSDDDVKKCIRIKTPELITSGPLTGSGRHWHVIATCCEGGHVEDDAKVIMATSSDDGKTWGKTQFLAEGKPAHGPNGIYDKIKDRLLVQYNSPDDSKTYQIISSDHGHSWSKPVDLSHQLKDCGHTGETAGSRIQTSTGRLLWYGGGSDHGKYRSCFWYSDDHGETYQTNAVKSIENEVSFSMVDHGGGGFIYANGRSINPDWKPYRIDYVSRDDGKTWGKSKSALKDPATEVERSLVYGDGVLYTASPKGTKDGPRMELIVSCSKDNGHTWPHSVNLGGDHYAGYSSLGYMGTHDRTLIVVWDHDRDDKYNPGGAPLFQIIDTKWCA